MILKEVNVEVRKTLEINYENGILCTVHLINDKMDHYRFHNEKYKLTYLSPEMVEYVINNTWGDVERENVNISLSFDELLKFEDFDNLYYLGLGMDGMFRKQDGTPISTLTRFDSIFCQCYLEIETTEKECQDILNSLKYVKSSKIIYIPYYNQTEEKNYHNTLDFNVLIPNDIYIEILNGEILNENHKRQIFEILKY